MPSNYFNIHQLHSTRILLYNDCGFKYTGQWDDYKGQGEINYKNGFKYIGEWDKDDELNIMKNGLGTLYSADGQVLNQGQWFNEEYVGKE